MNLDEADIVDDLEFSGLMVRARAGEASAIASLLAEFETDLRAMVRVHLPRKLRGKFDSLDFVQSVWASVFAGENEALGDFRNARHFRGYLAAMARNKVWAEYRRRTRTGKYDLRREEPLYVQRSGRDMPREVAAHDPSPSQLAQAKDRLNQIVGGRSALESQVVALRRQGLTFEEIAARLGVHERSIRRIIDDLRKRFEEGPRP